MNQYAQTFLLGWVAALSFWRGIDPLLHSTGSHLLDWITLLLGVGFLAIIAVTWVRRFRQTQPLRFVEKE